MLIDGPTFVTTFVTNTTEAIGSALRSLSESLPEGGCRLLPAMKISEEVAQQISGTMLAAYPGSGKRLFWVIVEGLTGQMAGDDWDVSENGRYVNLLKTSYPHPEGTWAWADDMNRSMLLIRNPRYALPSYHNIKYEMGLNETIYTLRAPCDDWILWRDANFDREIDRWGWLIDYWMEGGRRRATGLETDKCGDQMPDCKPIAIFGFERFLDPSTGPAETKRLAATLQHFRGVEMIEEDSRGCIHKQVLQKGSRYNPNRVGPKSKFKNFKPKQVNIMRAEVQRLKDKWAPDPWPVAQELVSILDDYSYELDLEYAKSWNNKGADQICCPPMNCGEGSYVTHECTCTPPEDPCSACPRGARCQTEPFMCIDCTCGFCNYEGTPCCDFNDVNNCKSNTNDNECLAQHDYFSTTDGSGSVCAGNELGVNADLKNCGCRPSPYEPCVFDVSEVHPDELCFMCTADDILPGSGQCESCRSCLLQCDPCVEAATNRNEMENCLGKQSMNQGTCRMDCNSICKKDIENAYPTF